MRVIEQAKVEDIPALCQLLALLFSQEAEFAPDVAAQHRGLSMIIAQPEVGAVLVLKENGIALGMVNLLFTVSTALGERVALLEDMVVVPQLRGSGAGSDLLSRAVALAREKGCKRITLLTDGDNEAAKRFYARQGFVESPMVPLRLALD